MRVYRAQRSSVAEKWVGFFSGERILFYLNLIKKQHSGQKDKIILRMLL